MTDIATTRSRGVQIIFALNKQALLNADPDVVPQMVRETLASWTVYDRPVGCLSVQIRGTPDT